MLLLQSLITTRASVSVEMFASTRNENFGRRERLVLNWGSGQRIEVCRLVRQKKSFEEISHSYISSLEHNGKL